MVEIRTWSRQDMSTTTEYFECADCVVTYGSDETIWSVRRHLGPDKPRVEYGHRISFGIVTAAADLSEAALGAAEDILMYDQQGCLSPRAYLVEGTPERSLQFTHALAQGLSRSRWIEIEWDRYQDRSRAAIVRQARDLALIDSDATVLPGPDLRWTLIHRPDPVLEPSPGCGVVNVAPYRADEIVRELRRFDGSVQGLSLATGNDDEYNEWACRLTAAGASWICLPGQLQRVPLHWRENGMDLLGSFAKCGSA